jgi:hypothetical protein
MGGRDMRLELIDHEISRMVSEIKGLLETESQMWSFVVAVAVGRPKGDMVNLIWHDAIATPAVSSLLLLAASRTVWDTIQTEKEQPHLN